MGEGGEEGVCNDVGEVYEPSLDTPLLEASLHTPLHTLLFTNLSIFPSHPALQALEAAQAEAALLSAKNDLDQLRSQLTASEVPSYRVRG